MKKIIRQFSLALPFLLFVPLSLLAQNNNDNDHENDHSDKEKKYQFVKTKAVNKSYNVSVADKLHIQNSFGAVEVHTWERNEIKVDVDIEVSANTDALAQKILDRISVSDDQSGKDISFKTNMKDINNSKGD